jgi:hypothetical protein
MSNCTVSIFGPKSGTSNINNILVPYTPIWYFELIYKFRFLMSSIIFKKVDNFFKNV